MNHSNNIQSNEVFQPNLRSEISKIHQQKPINWISLYNDLLKYGIVKRNFGSLSSNSLQRSPVISKKKENFLK